MKKKHIISWLLIVFVGAFILNSCITSMSSSTIETELESKYLTCGGTVANSYELLNNGYVSLADSQIDEIPDSVLTEFGITKTQLENYAQEYEDYQNYLASLGQSSMVKTIAMNTVYVSSTASSISTVVTEPTPLIATIGEDISPTEIIFSSGSVSTAYIYDVDAYVQVFNAIMYNTMDFVNEVVDIFMSDDGIGTELSSQIYRPNEYNTLINYSIDGGDATVIPVSSDALLGASLAAITSSRNANGILEVSIFITPESKVTTARLPTKEYKIIFVTKESTS